MRSPQQARRARQVNRSGFTRNRTMNPAQQLRRRRGFTLIETIVTVGLLAVLAAFVVPTVIQKAGAGDPVKVASDVTAIRTGLETFLSDVKGGYPNQLRALTDLPTIQNHYIDSTTAFTPAQITAW